MRELEMRQRIERFLKRRMQMMLAPALGLGMAVTGCQKESEPKSLYMGPMVDANPTAGASDSAPSFRDAAPADMLISADVAVAGSDAASDQPSPTDASARQDLAMQDLATIDASPELDAGTDAKPDSVADTSAEAGAGVDVVGDTGLIAKYMAPLPDGGPSDTGMIAKSRWRPERHGHGRQVYGPAASRQRPHFGAGLHGADAERVQESRHGSSLQVPSRRLSARCFCAARRGELKCHARGLALPLATMPRPPR
jgi:hypothetical protein